MTKERIQEYKVMAKMANSLWHQSDLHLAVELEGVLFDLIEELEKEGNKKGNKK